METLIEVVSAPLTITEEQQLAADEAVIERGLRTFYEVGMALTDIRENRLYRQTYHTFDEYCKGRWGFGDRRAEMLMSGAKTFDNIKGEHGVRVLPVYESQVRPLSGLDPNQQREAWQRAVETDPGSKITGPSGPHVAKVAEEIRQPMAVHYSSATPEWYTPQIIIDRVVEFFDEIDLDPCSNTGIPNIPASRVFTEQDNGLAHPWHGRVYMNPPYGDTIGLWVAKLCDAYQTGEIEAGIALLPGRIDTRWFRRLRSYAVCLLWGRLQFVGADNSAPFPSILVYLGDEIDRFRGVTASIGDVWTCVGVVPGDRQLEEVDL